MARLVKNQQTSLFAPPQPQTVSQLTLRIRKLLEEDEELREVWVEGEVSNLSRPASGHVYFTLKDRGAAIRCVMWRSDAMRLQFRPQDGISVEARGKIALYEPQGQYQLVVSSLQPRGEGALFVEFLRLKAALEAEGLFAAEGKRAIPELPGRIGVITSASGAAVQDILNTLARRMPLAEVLLAPTLVQGTEAPPALVEALNKLNQLSPDVIILARGGGSLEDLWAFNDERVVRAVAASATPVICGVGHETDFTLSDFAADLRAPTPTAAAELASSITIADLKDGLQAGAQALVEAITDQLEQQERELTSLAMRLRYTSPQRRLQAEAQHLDDLGRRLQRAQAVRLDFEMQALDGLGRRLAGLNPMAVLERGYAIVTRRADRALVSGVDAAQGIMDVRVRDGSFGVIRQN